MRKSLDFRVLGPLEVIDGDRPIDLGPAQQKALLALLIINVGRVVTTDRILEELWGDNAVGKENALWVYVSRLRSALEPDRSGRGPSSLLITKDHGYTLTVDRMAVDAHRFEQAAEQGRALLRKDPVAAAQLFSGALELWRGSALEDFTYYEFAQVEITRLESLRLDVLENRIEADLRRGLAGELVGELENLRASHPLREGFVAQLMLALYQAGRQADAIRSFEVFQRQLGEELGLEPSPELRRLEEQVLLHDPGLRVRLPVIGERGLLSVARNPFKGLRPFGEDDAKEFFGRERLVADLTKRVLDDNSLLALVGPSGSGKSSVLNAGLIAALRKSEAIGTESWQIASMVPGSRPFAELEAALLRSSLDVPDSLAELLNHSQDGALKAGLRVLRGDGSRLLLVIDQFEELFTLAEDEARNRFIANLVPMIDDPHNRFTVVVAVRAGFYDRILDFPELATRMDGRVLNLVPPTPDELEEAAQRPAEAVGVVMAPSLLASLLTDVVGRPGSLPLFQYALTELFDRRSDDVLTLDLYNAMGGLQGVLTRKADDQYADLSTQEREAARQLFLRLVAITDDDEWTRRRVPASEIVSLGVDLVALQRVIETFTASHLLTLDRDSVSGSPTVEVAHEALLTEWDTLRGLIEDGRDDIKRQAALSAALNEWRNSGHHPDFLLAGSRLAGYEDWQSTSVLELTREQRKFLDTSIAGRENAESAERERASLAEGTRRKARRRLWAVVTLATILLGAGAFALLAAIQPGPFTVAVIAPSVAPYEDSLVATGVARAERELPVEIDFRRRVANLEDEYRSLAAAGTDLIFIDPGSSGWEYVTEVIDDFPDTAFAVVDGVVPPAGAMSTYIADEGGGYLAGLAAGLTTETGTVGFVGHRQSETSELWRAGFEAGAKAARPGVQVVATYISSDPNAWEDIEGGRRAAAELFGLGADVVLAFAEEANLGVIDAARETSRQTGIHRWAIGSGSDWSVEVAEPLEPHVLTSAFKRWDVAIFETMRKFTEGDFEPGISILALEHDAVGLAESQYLTGETMSTIAELGSSVVSASAGVPRMPVDELRPPPGLVVTHELIVTWDGQECVYSGESEFAADSVFRVEFVNNDTSHRQFWNLWSRGGSFDVPLFVLVAPGSSHFGYMAPGRGDVELKCGPDLRDGRPRQPSTAGVISLG